MKIYFDIKKIFVNFAFEKATYGKKRLPFWNVVNSN